MQIATVVRRWQSFFYKIYRNPIPIFPDVQQDF